MNMMTRTPTHRSALTSLAAVTAVAALVACSSNSGNGATAGTGAGGSTNATGGSTTSTGGSTTSTGGSTTSTGGSTTTTTTTATTSSSSSSGGCSPANVILLPAQTILAAVQPSALAVADVNKDGKVDLVYSEEGTLVVSLSQGNSTFAAAKTYEGAGYNDLVVGDLNGDGWPDVLSPGSDNENVILAYAPNNMDGTFGAFQNIVELSDIGTRQALADFNGDGKLDIANLGSSVTILMNGGNGTFPGNGTAYGESTSAAWAACFGSDDVVDFAVGDLNGDGLPDIVVVVAGQSASSPGGIYVSLNQNHGSSFSDPIHYATTENHDPLSIVIADFDGDGFNDIVTGGASSDLFNVYLNKGGASAGTFKAAAAVTPSGNASATSLVAADMNHDGKIDLVAFYGFGGGPWVALGNGDGTFSTTLEAYSAGADQEGNEPLGVGDFNGNGLNGIAVLNTTMTTAAPNGGVQVLQASCAP
jgi:hypothetical protein